MIEASRPRSIGEWISAIRHGIEALLIGIYSGLMIGLEFFINPISVVYK